MQRVSWFSDDFRTYLTGESGEIKFEEFINSTPIGSTDNYINRFFKEITAYGLTSPGTMTTATTETLKDFLAPAFNISPSALERPYQEMKGHILELVRYVISEEGVLVVPGFENGDYGPGVEQRFYRSTEVQSMNPYNYSPIAKSLAIPCPDSRSTILEPIYYGILSDNVADAAVETYKGYSDITHQDATPYGIVSCRSVQPLYKINNDTLSINFLLNLMLGGWDSTEINPYYINGELTQRIENAFLIYVAKVYCDLSVLGDAPLTVELLKDRANDIYIVRPLKGYDCDEKYKTAGSDGIPRYTLGTLLQVYNKPDGVSTLDNNRYDRATFDAKLPGRERLSFYYQDRLYIQSLFEIMEFVFAFISFAVISFENDVEMSTSLPAGQDAARAIDHARSTPNKVKWINPNVYQHLQTLLPDQWSAIEPYYTITPFISFRGTYQGYTPGFHPEVTLSLPNFYDEKLFKTFFQEKSDMCKPVYFVNTHYTQLPPPGITAKDWSKQGSHDIDQSDMHLYILETQQERAQRGEPLLKLPQLAIRHRPEYITAYYNAVRRIQGLYKDSIELHYYVNRDLLKYIGLESLPSFYTKPPPSANDLYEYYKDKSVTGGKAKSKNETESIADFWKDMNRISNRLLALKNNTQRENYQMINREFFDPKYDNFGGVSIFDKPSSSSKPLAISPVVSKKLTPEDIVKIEETARTEFAKLNLPKISELASPRTKSNIDMKQRSLITTRPSAISKSRTTVMPVATVATAAGGSRKIKKKPKKKPTKKRTKKHKKKRTKKHTKKRTKKHNKTIKKRTTRKKKF